MVSSEYFVVFVAIAIAVVFVVVVVVMAIVYGIVAWRAEIYIFIAYPEHKIASFIINFGNARPIVMSHRRLVAQHDNPAGRQAQKVLDTVLALEEQKELRMSLSFRLELSSSCS